MIKSKRTLKIIFGLIVFFTLPSLLFFGFVYYKYHEDLPIGKQGVKADSLAQNMLNALNYDAFKNTNYIEWTYKKRRHYKWEKSEDICTIYWEDFKVILNLNQLNKSKVFIHNFKANKEQEKLLLDKAINYFKQDSFWLIAPYKVFDKNVERSLVKLENGDYALLTTFTEGDLTADGSYLWMLDKYNKPTHFKMWVSSLPIDGLEATWSDWITTESGAQLPLHHQLLFLGIDLGEVKGTN